MVWLAWCCCLHGKRTRAHDAEEMTPLLTLEDVQVRDADRQFVDACERDDVAAVRELVNSGAVNAKRSSQLRLTKEILSPVFDSMDHPSATAWLANVSPLLIAVVAGNSAIVEILLDAGFDAKQSFPSEKGEVTLLHLASFVEDAKTVKLLLRAGCELEKKDANGNTALARASYAGQAEVVRVLLQAGANVASKDIDGRTALAQASSEDHLEVVQLLVKAGGRSQGKSEQKSLLALGCINGDVSAVRALLAAGADINETNKSGASPIHHASSHGHIEVVRVLLNAGAAPNVSDDVGETPLFRAFDSGHFEIVRLLLDTGVDVNGPNKDGENLLFRAFRLCDGASIQRLLAYGVDVNATNEGGETLLFGASSRGEAELVKLLLNAGADVAAQSKCGETPLFRACSSGQAQVVKILLKSGALVNAADSGGDTPLFRASRAGHSEVVKLLLASGASVTRAHTSAAGSLFIAASRGQSKNVPLLPNADVVIASSTQNGQSALHQAGNAVVAALLLATEATPHAVDQDGNTALHEACRVPRYDVARVLLEHDANVTAENKDGHQPLHCVLFTMWKESRMLAKQGMLKMLQLLVLHGAQWDALCEAIVNQNSKPNSTSIDDRRWRKEAPAIRVCVRRWMLECEQKLDLTPVPFEEVRRGVSSTIIYLKEITISRKIVYRRKICVVGPSYWGKTSLIKSLLAQQPCLVHQDDRTIGIDHFKLKFEDEFSDLKTTKRHEVTFWDFAGQDAYQVTHSLFFSARTLFVVVVDLESYNVARLQAQLMTDFDSESDKWLNEFIDTRVLRWIRLIFACQPDADFVFIATKKDRVIKIDEGDEDDTLQDLIKRLENVMVITEDMKEAFTQRQQEGGSLEASHDPKFITRLGDPRLQDRMKPPLRIIVSSCVAPEDVNSMRNALQNVIRKSDRGFAMPDKYTLVLNAVEKLRMEAAELSTDKRLHKAFENIDRLLLDLQARVKDPNGRTSGDSYFDHETGRTILRTLRDLGDVLWYEDIGDAKLQSTVILDPLLLIDFVRQIFTHKHTAETMPHSKLKGLSFWRHLDQDNMLAMKRVLQHFNLVYPTVGDMDWDSDLIVPAYWKSNTCAFWKFGGDILRLGRQTTEAELALRVHWEFHFPIEFPDSLFDNLVVMSYAPTYTRDVGPDWILYEVEGVYACRIVIGRDHATHERSLHVEAVLASSGRDEAGALWMTFEYITSKLGHVLRRYPGLPVSSFARTRANAEHSLRSVFASPRSPDCEKWMPPASTWPVYAGILPQKTT